jgi:hypothetical protein
MCDSHIMPKTLATAAAQLGVSRRQVYVLLRRWRQGEGVVSDLLPRPWTSGPCDQVKGGPVSAGREGSEKIMFSEAPNPRTSENEGQAVPDGLLSASENTDRSAHCISSHEPERQAIEVDIDIELAKLDGGWRPLRPARLNELGLAL